MENNHTNFAGIGMDESDGFIVIPKATMDKMLKTEHPGELAGLYCFYFYTAVWQKNYICKAVEGYVASGMHWNKSKVRRFKKILINLGLITMVRRRKPNGKWDSWYMQVNYIPRELRKDWKKPNSGVKPKLSPVVPKHTSGGLDDLNTLVMVG